MEMLRTDEAQSVVPRRPPDSPVPPDTSPPAHQALVGSHRPPRANGRGPRRRRWRHRGTADL